MGFVGFNGKSEPLVKFHTTEFFLEGKKGKELTKALQSILFGSDWIWEHPEILICHNKTFQRMEIHQERGCIMVHKRCVSLGKWS